MRPNVVTDDQLTSIVRRIVTLKREKKERDAITAADIADIMLEAKKSEKYDMKALRLLIRKEIETDEELAARRELEDAAEMLKAQLGDYATTGLGAYAVAAAE